MSHAAILPNPVGAVTIRLVPGAALDGLAGDWQSLLARRPGSTVFAGPMVQAAHRAVFEAGHDPVAVVAEGAEGLLALWPLTRRRVAAGPIGWRELAFARNAHTLRNHLLLSDRPEVLPAMLSACLALPGWETLAFDNLPEDEALAEALPRAAQSAGLACDPPTTGRVLLHADLADGIEAYHATRSGQFRRQLRKRARELEALGRVEIEALEGPALGARLAEWQAVAARSWQAEEAADTLTEADWRFHAALSGCGRLWLLRIDGRPVACLRMLEEGGTAYVHTMHYDRALRDHAPGLVLFARMMEDAAARGLARVDFNGNTPFFQRWATGEVTHRNWRLYRPGTAGQAMRLARAGLRGLRRMAGTEGGAA